MKVKYLKEVTINHPHELDTKRPFVDGLSREMNHWKPPSRLIPRAPKLKKWLRKGFGRG